MQSSDLFNKPLNKIIRLQEVVTRNDENNKAKPPPPKYTSPSGINLAAFAEDDEDNMEDWLDSQIS